MKNKTIVLFIFILVLFTTSFYAVDTRAVTVFPESADCDATNGVMGDLNHDSFVNANDIAVMTQMTKGLAPFNACADISADGFIGPGDIAALQQLINYVKNGLAVPSAHLYEHSFYNPYRLPRCQTIYGDVNGDLVADYQDVGILVEMATGRIPANICGDSDRDGYIGPGDISMVTSVSKGYPAFVDYIKPVITITGANIITLEVNSVYTDLGATATDNKDGDLTGSIKTDSSALNMAVVSSYNIRYNVTDSDTNEAIEALRQVNVVDTTKPVIALNGADPQIIEIGNAYSELGVTVTDNYDVAISPVIDASAVNIGAVGSYTVTYDATDSNGNVAVQVTRTVKVEDKTLPVIALLGSDPQEILINTSYVELGATASDNFYGDISGSLVIDASAVDITTVGNYIVTYNVTDANGNVAVQVTRTVKVVDKTSPIITLLGTIIQNIEYGSPYAELGATAIDNVDGDLSAKIVIGGVAAINTSVLGTYTVTYDVTDSNGNAAVQAIRTVNVVDTTKPVITLTGVNPQIINVGDAYAELGATATDNFDGVITPITINSAAVNTAIVGSYNVTYDVTDSNGNAAVQLSRTVNVVDTIKPVITLTGANPQLIKLGTPYIELGATAADNYDGDITVKISINAVAVNTGTVGNYTVTYNVSDSSANAAVQVTRTVSVYSPVISGVGGSSDTTAPVNASVKINNGDATTQTSEVTLSLFAEDYNVPLQMMISNTEDFSALTWEAYNTTKSWTLTAGEGLKNVYAKFKDSYGNTTAVVSDSITVGQTAITENPGTVEGEVLGEKYVEDRELQLAEIYDDAHYIWPGDLDLLLGYMNMTRNLALEQSMNTKYLALLAPEVKLASAGNESSVRAVTNFLAYGTKTTLKLGAGERAGVLNSYKTAFGSLPKTEEQWRDAIKIANGRWPNQTSTVAETRAQANFKKVYLRTADLNNAKESAAIMIMAYGMRPQPRNVASESAAIKIFKGIFGYYPKTAVNWDILRTIAYSGVQR
ncbi:MAG: DUF5011 domain-containing protein [Candidatus Parcubacteria bacterium]|nr:DUF5011 domain-containing protein [Candidatus Parcubacteria bacterium]